jgi:hypothetical protein
MDFPGTPAVGQRYTNSVGVVYEWNGEAWVIGYYDSDTQQFALLDDLVNQIRVLLQDVDVSSGEYRYSTDSIVMNLNMGLWEMYRLRPDIFLPLDFVVPQFSAVDMSAAITIETQYVPMLIYYAVGLTQLRDDEETQDARAMAFKSMFMAGLMSVQ